MRLSLRWYQEKALERVFEELRAVRSTLVVLPTGSGKSVLFAHLAKRTTGRVLVIVHLDALVWQTVRTVRSVCGEEPAVEMGANWSDESGTLRSRVVVTSVQTMRRPGRQERFRPEDFDLVITDEAHHAVGKSYRDAAGYYMDGNPLCKHVGVTATPVRKDKLALGQVFETVAFEWGITEAKDDGWLVPVYQRVVTIDGLDYSKLKVVAGDFSEKELVEAVEPHLLAMAKATAAEAGNLPTLVFCANVAQSAVLADLLNGIKPKSAAFIAGEEACRRNELTALDKEGQRAVIKAYRAGQIQFLCSCQMLLEGFDAPDTAIVSMCRATKSLTVYTQALGRGTRPATEIAEELGRLATAAERRALILGSSKPALKVIDFCGNAGRHHIVMADDVLGGRYGTPVREAARQNLANEGKACPVEQALERAQLEIEFLEWVDKQRVKRALLAQAAEVAYHSSDVALGGAAPRVQTAATKDPLLDWQFRKLVQFGVDRQTASGYSRRQAFAVLASMEKRRQDKAG